VPGRAITAYASATRPPADTDCGLADFSRAPSRRPPWRKAGGISRAAVGNHRPSVEIAKPDGQMRRLSIPPVRDRVAQSAARLVLAPLLDAGMSPTSFAYRKGSSVEQAAALVTVYRLRGYCWVVDGDITEFFPSLGHQPLLSILEAAIS
jgi:hypothetical protein